MKRLFVIVTLLMFSGELHAQRHEFNYTYKLWQDSAPTLTLDEVVSLLGESELYESADFQRKLNKSLRSRNEEDRKIANFAMQIDDYNRSSGAIIEAIRGLGKHYMDSTATEAIQQMSEHIKLELEKIYESISEMIKTGVKN